MKILLRCNAGNKYGLGHLVRCIALAKTLEDKTHDIFFIIKTDNKHRINDFLSEEGVSIKKYIFLKENLSKDDDVFTIINHYKNGFSFLILDHYEHDLQYQKKIFEAGIKWAQFDYKAEEQILANIVINGNISATKEMYRNIKLPGTLLCVGYEYAILRTKFLNQLANPQKNKILIALGGGIYPDEVIEMIQFTVKDYKFSYEVVSNDDRLRKKLSNYKNATLHINTSNVLPVYKKCSVAIVAGGVTTFELAALNIPLIIVPFAENQELNAIAWEQNNFGINFKNPLNFKNIAGKIGMGCLIDDVYKAFKNRKITIDGLGATKIVKEINKIA
jgi:UDP-2,4-diacetamido-2,4,6-trideoxy-beta-L-altropyranose hydrolase